MIDWTVQENRFLLGDCMEYMATIPDKCFDLAIVDPPYGINIGKNGKVCGSKPFGSSQFRHGIGLGVIESTQYKPFDDSEIPPELFFSELFRISKNQIIWGGNYFPLPPSSCIIVWDKVRTGFFADCELAWTSFNSAVKKFTWEWNGMLQQNMRNKERRIHPTQKPIALYRWLLQNYAKPGWTILDTHGGSGSSAIACEWEGYTYTWIEKDKDYYRDAKKRIEQWREGRTLDMFEKFKNNNGTQLDLI